MIYALLLLSCCSGCRRSNGCGCSSCCNGCGWNRSCNNYLSTFSDDFGVTATNFNSAFARSNCGCSNCGWNNWSRTNNCGCSNGCGCSNNWWLTDNFGANFNSDFPFDAAFSRCANSCERRCRRCQPFRNSCGCQGSTSVFFDGENVIV